MKNRIVSILLALAMLFVIAVNASATNAMPDLDKKGSLTFTMELGGQPLTSGKLNLYQVGTIEELSEDEYGFRLFAAVGRTAVTQDELYDPVVAEEILTSAKDSGLPAITAPIENGTVKFENLQTGLYVVWQDEGDAPEGLLPIQPFLISVPRWQGDHYALDVEAEPKVPVETKPTEPTEPTTPPDDKLPQTGQLNWPIPVMALSGAVLMIIGWILCLGRKRSGYEK